MNTRFLRVMLFPGLAALTAVAFGCGGDMHVRATVTASPCGAKEAPVAGATVSMDCPQVIKASGASELGKTDARGEFALDEPVLGRWLHDGCELIVEKPGYQTKRFPVEAVCTKYSVNHCTLAMVTAKLAPTSPCP